MGKILNKIFTHRSPFDSEVKKARKDVLKCKDDVMAPRFHPVDGGYEYQRYVDIPTASNNNKLIRRKYKAYMRLAFSPAPDFGWIISGVANEWWSDRSEDLVKVVISDGRIVGNGRFYWIEERRGGGKAKHLVTGSLEPTYKVCNNAMVVDTDAAFQAKYICADGGGRGDTDWKPLKKFYLRQGQDPSIEKPPSERERKMVEKMKRYQEIQKKYALKQKNGDPLDESTEEPTEEEDYRIAIRSIAEMTALAL